MEICRSKVGTLQKNTIHEVSECTSNVIMNMVFFATFSLEYSDYIVML